MLNSNVHMPPLPTTEEGNVGHFPSLPSNLEVMEEANIQSSKPRSHSQSGQFPVVFQSPSQETIQRIGVEGTGVRQRESNEEKNSKKSQNTLKMQLGSHLQWFFYKFLRILPWITLLVAIQTCFDQLWLNESQPPHYNITCLPASHLLLWIYLIFLL